MQRVTNGHVLHFGLARARSDFKNMKVCPWQRPAKPNIVPERFNNVIDEGYMFDLTLLLMPLPRRVDIVRPLLLLSEILNHWVTLSERRLLYICFI